MIVALIFLTSFTNQHFKAPQWKTSICCGAKVVRLKAVDPSCFTDAPNCNWPLPHGHATFSKKTKLQLLHLFSVGVLWKILPLIFSHSFTHTHFLFVSPSLPSFVLQRHLSLASPASRAGSSVVISHTHSHINTHTHIHTQDPTKVKVSLSLFSLSPDLPSLVTVQDNMEEAKQRAVALLALGLI